jgi:spore germination cell wall hydrolase CwlJ-like protein
MKKFLLSAILLVCNSLGSANTPYHQPVKHTQRDVRCLADNIYHEARGEPFRGQLAVAQVTINRFRSNRHGKTICAVVHQRRQFSWTNNKPRVRDLKRWQDSYTVAQFMLTGAQMQKFPANFYHTKKVNPYWNRTKRITHVIGNHIFYK